MADTPDIDLAPFAQMLEGTAPLRELVAGYRASLMNDCHFDHETSGQMAVEFHSYLIALLKKTLPMATA